MSAESRAQEFGRHFKQGGWLLGFLVASCVEHGGTGGRPSANSSPENGSGKVSMSRFAEISGVSKSHVSYCFRAWQLAAEEGHCTPAEQLTPGSQDGGRDDIDDDGAEDRDLWSKFYDKVRRRVSSDPAGTEGGASAKSAASQHDSGDKASKAAEALAKTSGQLEKRLAHVLDSPPLRGSDGEMALFADELRRTRCILDAQCREIDQMLNRLGFGDTVDAPTAEVSVLAVVPESSDA